MRMFTRYLDYIVWGVLLLGFCSAAVGHIPIKSITNKTEYTLLVARMDSIQDKDKTIKIECASSCSSETDVWFPNEAITFIVTRYDPKFVVNLCHPDLHYCDEILKCAATPRGYTSVWDGVFIPQGDTYADKCCKQLQNALILCIVVDNRYTYPFAYITAEKSGIKIHRMFPGCKSIDYPPKNIKELQIVVFQDPYLADGKVFKKVGKDRLVRKDAFKIDLILHEK